MRPVYCLLKCMVQFWMFQNPYLPLLRLAIFIKHLPSYLAYIYYLMLFRNYFCRYKGDGLF